MTNMYDKYFLGNWKQVFILFVNKVHEAFLKTAYFRTRSCHIENVAWRKYPSQSTCTEAYLLPCQTPMMELLANIVNG